MSDISDLGAEVEAVRQAMGPKFDGSTTTGLPETAVAALADQLRRGRLPKEGDLPVSGLPSNTNVTFNAIAKTGMAERITALEAECEALRAQLEVKG